MSNTGPNSTCQNCHAEFYGHGEKRCSKCEQIYGQPLTLLEPDMKDRITKQVIKTVLSGPELKRVRESVGLTQKELAEKVKISAPFLSDLEADRRKCSRAVLVRIVAALEEAEDVVR